MTPIHARARGALARRTPAPIRFALAVQRRYGADGAGYLASTIAYHAFLSLFPMLLLALSVMGFVLAGEPDLRARWTAQLARALPGSSELFGDGLNTIVRARATAGLVGLAGLAWSGAGVVRAAGHALHVVFRVDSLSGVRAHVWALGSFAGLGLLAAISVGISGLVGASEAAWARIAAIAVTLMLDGILFLVAYRVLTQRKGPPFADLWRGAMLAAAGWTTLKLLGSWYVARTVGGARAVYGAFAVTIGALLLLSMAARLFMYGAVVNVVSKEGVVEEERIAQLPPVGNGSAVDGSNGDGRRPMGDIVRSIALGTGTLVRKEAELAKQEIGEAIGDRARALAVVAAGGTFAIVGLVFLGLAATAALSQVLEPAWLSPLIVAFGFFVLGGIAAAIALGRASRKSLALDETRRTIKEDVEWAREQLKR